jgi:hypothetical protein
VGRSGGGGEVGEAGGCGPGLLGGAVARESFPASCWLLTGNEGEEMLDTVGMVRLDWGSMRLLAAGSTKRRWRLRKSTPRIGNCTFANKKVQVKRRPWNFSCSCFSPQQAIERPVGPLRRGPCGGAFEK